MVCEAYGYGRVDEHDIYHRLGMGDAGQRANRVLHLAWRMAPEESAVLVGCCSSTVQPPWTERGCGHWGLLVVAKEYQGSGVGSLLVAAAEARLAARKCTQIQIEYEFISGDPVSERLAAWYEGKCGFHCMQPRSTQPGRHQFRRCRKAVKKINSKSAPRGTPESSAMIPAPPPCNKGNYKICPKWRRRLLTLASAFLQHFCPSWAFNADSSSVLLSKRESTSHGAE